MRRAASSRRGAWRGQRTSLSPYPAAAAGGRSAEEARAEQETETALRKRSSESKSRLGLALVADDALHVTGCRLTWEKR